MVYPHKWSPVSYKSSAGQRNFAGQKPTFYRCATQPTVVSRSQHSFLQKYGECSSFDTNGCVDQSINKSIVEFNVPFQNKYGYIRNKRSGVKSYPYPVKEGQQYINLNPGRLFLQQTPRKRKGSRGSFKLLC